MAENVRKLGSNNFADTSYWTLGALADTDTLVIASGKESFSTFGLSARDFAGVRFEQDYGDEVTNVGVIDFACSAGVFIFNGKCATMRIGGAGSFHTIVWAPRNPSAKLILQGTGAVTSRLLVQSGLVQVDSTFGSANPAIIDVQGGDVLVKQHATHVPDVNVEAGRLVTLRDYGTMNIGGSGQVDHDLAHPDVASPATGGTITINSAMAALNLLSGSLATLNARAGLVDKRKVRRALTISTANWFPLATEGVKEGGVTVTESARNAYGTGPKRVN